MVLGVLVFLFVATVVSSLIFLSLSIQKSPFSNDVLETSYTVGEVVHDVPSDLVFQREAFLLKPDVRLNMSRLLNYTVETLEAGGVEHWAVKQTMLGAIRHQGIVPFDDEISLGFNHDDLVGLVGLRSRIEASGEFLLTRKNSQYFLSFNNAFRFPRVTLTPMKNEKEEVLLCSPLDELNRCTFSDSYQRRREVYTQKQVYPLRKVKFEDFEIYVPNHAEECLDVLLNTCEGNKDWRTWTPVKRYQIVDNSVTRFMLGL